MSIRKSQARYLFLGDYKKIGNNEFYSFMLINFRAVNIHTCCLLDYQRGSYNNVSQSNEKNTENLTSNYSNSKFIELYLHSPNLIILKYRKILNQSQQRDNILGG